MPHVHRQNKNRIAAVIVSPGARMCLLTPGDHDDVVWPTQWWASVSCQKNESYVPG